METMSGLKRLPLLMGLALALAVGAGTVLVVDDVMYRGHSMLRAHGLNSQRGQLLARLSPHRHQRPKAR